MYIYRRYTLNIFTDGVHDQQSLETPAVESQNLTMQGPDKGLKKAISKALSEQNISMNIRVNKKK